MDIVTKLSGNTGHKELTFRTRVGVIIGNCEASVRTDMRLRCQTEDTNLQDTKQMLHNSLIIDGESG